MQAFEDRDKLREESERDERERGRRQSTKLRRQDKGDRDRGRLKAFKKQKRTTVTSRQI